MNLSHMTVDWSNNWTNLSVLRHRRFDGFLVTSKNSGTHWVKYMLAVALADTYGIPRPRYFSEKAVRPYIGGAKDRPTFSALPRLAFSHTIPHRLADWRWARKLANLPPYVLCVRHPMSILASHYAKWEYMLNIDWFNYLRGDPAGKAFRCDLFWLARFWNRWGTICARYPDETLVMHYEKTRADPRAALTAIARHWNIVLTPDSIDTALAEGTKEAMAKKTDPDGEPNVLQNRSTKLSELFTEEAWDIYRGIVRAYFRHDLGYDLMAMPDK